MNQIILLCCLRGNKAYLFTSIRFYIWQWGYCGQERPYNHDSTASRLLSEVKHDLVRLVLRWGTTLEYLMLFFCSSSIQGILPTPHPHFTLVIDYLLPLYLLLCWSNFAGCKVSSLHVLQITFLKWWWSTRRRSFCRFHRSIIIIRQENDMNYDPKPKKHTQHLVLLVADGFPKLELIQYVLYYYYY